MAQLTLRLSYLPASVLLTAAVLALAGCSKPKPTGYTAEVTDQSGATYVVEPQGQPSVQVTLPKTPVTPVPAASSTPTKPSPRPNTAPAGG